MIERNLAWRLRFNDDIMDFLSWRRSGVLNLRSYLAWRETQIYKHMDERKILNYSQLFSDFDNIKIKHPILFEMAFHYVKKNLPRVYSKFHADDECLINYFGSRLLDFLKELLTYLKNCYNPCCLKPDINWMYERVNNAMPKHQRCKFQSSVKKKDIMVDTKSIYKSWHESSRFITAIKNCASECTIPPDRMKEARDIIHHIIGDIVEELKTDSIFVTPEFVGSTSEGLNVNVRPFEQHPIELDVMLVWDVGEIIEKVPSPIANRCFMVLKPGTNIPMQSIADEDDHNNRYLGPPSLLEFFRGKIEMCCRKYGRKHWNATTELIDHDPGIQMDGAIPKKKKEDAALKFSIDIVSTLKMNNEEYYVPKCSDKFDHMFFQRGYSWRRSFSILEKNEILRIIPEKKNLMRVFKYITAIIDHYLHFYLFSSYQMKNVFLKVCHKFSNDELWSEKYLGLRLIDLLQEGISDMSEESQSALLLPTEC
ncbi:hypothetical protein HELRODRAFT_182965 [Helobdella robusta]|uniref:Uncharacterized protein n=1 Tax=Helobdella robusta TaxID=6412 RepID=T1FJ01_HELRO|nr:hypothetical protein HELRODRAFT_182965 [Helobdella robusta]ESN89956.1 hypothetical protein HELRODRAFT_182965 [Helobdella robusta]